MKELHRYDLLPYQEQAIDFIKTHENCALWLDMGLGKTVSTLTAFLDMRESFDVKKMLVVAPLRVARSVWTDEIKTWSHLHGLKTSQMLGSEKERLRALNAGADIHLINRENLVWLSEQVIQGKKQIRKWPWDLVVLDESQSFRSQSSYRWKSLRRVRKIFPRCIELTGTPSPNGYSNLWSQIFLLDRGLRLGNTETAFRERWFNQPGYEAWNWTLKPHAKQEIQKLLSDIVLCIQGEKPPIDNNYIKVRLSVQEMALYKKFERSYIMNTVNGNKITAVSAGACYGKLLQLANGSIYINDRKEFEIFHNEKIKALEEVLEGVNGPTMICYSFKADLKRISDCLTKFCGKVYRWDVLNDKASEEQWNLGKTDFLILHPGSAGHGLNLQHSGSTTIVWFGLSPDLELYQQANARLIGGLRGAGKTFVLHHIVAEGTVDEDVITLIDSKATDQHELQTAITLRSQRL